MPARILIVKLSSMGDIVHALPAVQAVRRAWPEARLAWAVDEPHAALLAGQPWLDEVIVWRRDTWRGLWDLLRGVRRFRPDVAIDLQGLLRSAVVTYASGAWRRIGMRSAREGARWLYSETVPVDYSAQHAVERLLAVVALLRASCAAVPIERPYLHNAAPRPMPVPGRSLFPLHPTAADRAEVDRWLGEHRFDPATQRLILLNPHCRKDANRWPAARFSELAARLLELPRVRVALTGGGIARAVCDEIAVPLGDRLWRADGAFGLLASTVLLARASVMVTGDTGPMHLAVAVDTPVVALFGPARPLQTGPYSSQAIVLSESLACSPCFARHACPLGHNPPLCMDQLSVDRVADAVLRQLAATDSAIPLRRTG